MLVYYALAYIHFRLTLFDSSNPGVTPSSCTLLHQAWLRTQKEVNADSTGLTLG